MILAASVAVAQPSEEARQADVAEIITLDTFESVGRFLYTDKINALRTPTPVIDVQQSLSIYTA